MRLLVFAIALSALGAGSFWVLTQGPLAPSGGVVAESDSAGGALARPSPPAGGALAAPAPPVPEAPSVRERVTHQTYAVTGQTADAVLRSLLEHGPRDGDDIFFGLTETDFDVRYDPRPISGGCLIEDTRVTIGVVITLPEWLPAAEVDSDLLTNWGRFRRALAAHEEQHRVIAIEGGEAAYEAIAGLYRSSCDAAVSETRARLDRLGVEVVAAHQRLDEETQHGKTTGAFWPPR